MNNSKSPTAITQNSKLKIQNSILLADLVGGGKSQTMRAESPMFSIAQGSALGNG